MQDAGAGTQLALCGAKGSANIRRPALQRNSYMQLDDKLVVVTGSGRGIGRAMALAFAQKRAHLALLDLDEAALGETRAQCQALGVRAHTYVCNVAHEEQMTATFDAIVNDCGRLDVMINNAGITKD